MRRKLFIKGIPVAATLSLLAIVGIKSSFVNVDQYQDYSALISDQLVSASAVELALQNNRYSISADEQSLNTALAEEEQVQAQLLEKLPNSISKDAQRRLQKQLDFNAELLDEKRNLIEQFAVHNADLRAALTQQSNALNQLRQSGRVSLEVEALLDEVLLYIMTSDEQRVASIETKLQRLKAKLNSGGITGRQGAEQIAQQIDIVLENKPVVDRLMMQVLELPLTNNIRALDQQFNDIQQSTQQRRSDYRNLIYLLLLASLGMVAYWVIRRLSRSSQRTVRVLESITDAFIALDPKWKITYVNAQAAELLRYDIPKLLEQDFWKVLPESLGKRFAKQYRLATTERRIVSFETYYEPTERWLMVRGYPGRDGLSIFLQDVTERKQAEEELLELNRNLDGRVQDRTTQLRQAMEEAEQAMLKAEEANRSKSEFLANMSHELRTPLNAIIGYSEMLEDEAIDLEEEDFVLDLQKIQGAGKHLLGLINSVLDLSKIESGRMDLFLEDIDVRTLVDEIADTVQPLIRKNNNELSIFCPEHIEMVHSDQVKLRQCLFNLLSNACKFTDGGSIALSVEQIDAVDGDVYEGDWLRFTVSDTGIGMNPEQMEKIFQAFTQADASTTRKYGGTGLGLAITKQFITMMGGNVSVDSLYGQGTTFTITIPTVVQPLSIKNETVLISAEPSPKPKIDTGSRRKHRTSDSLGKTILVIDDDADAREILSRSLTDAGYNVVCAVDGKQGVTLATELLPDAITLDVMLPQQDGWSVLKELNTIPTVSNIPVIMLSVIEDRPLGHALGAADYLTKPIDRRRLMSVLDNHLVGKTSSRILVVEDDVNAREIMRRFLKQHDWMVDLVANGRQALDYLNSASTVPDAIVLDLMMPEMDGFEFMQVLRQTSDWSDIPVIVVTAKALTVDDQQQLGGIRVYQKTELNRQTLLNEVQAAVSISADDGAAMKK